MLLIGLLVLLAMLSLVLEEAPVVAPVLLVDLSNVVIVLLGWSDFSVEMSIFSVVLCRLVGVLLEDDLVLSTSVFVLPISVVLSPFVLVLPIWSVELCILAVVDSEVPSVVVACL